MNDHNIAERIKKLRTDNNLSQSQLADKFKGKIDNCLDDDYGKQLISKLENNKTGLTVPTARAYSEIFGVSLDYIYSNSQHKFESNKSSKVAQQNENSSEDNTKKESLFTKLLEEEKNSERYKQGTRIVPLMLYIEKCGQELKEKENAKSSRFCQLLEEANDSIWHNNISKYLN